MERSHRLYKVVETKDLTEEELQTILNDATDGLPEMQIDHIVGSKIILGYDSNLNASSRLTMKTSSRNGQLNIADIINHNRLKQ